MDGFLGWITQNIGLRFGGPGNAVGENTATPTGTTILGRLKAITDAVRSPRITGARTLRTMGGTLTNNTANAPQSILLSVVGGTPAASYTVTAGNRLYIPSIFLATTSTVNTDTNVTIEMGVNGVWTTVIVVAVRGSSTRTVTVPLTFPDTIQLSAGTTLAFRLTQTTTAATLSTVSLVDAYEVPE